MENPIIDSIIDPDYDVMLDTTPAGMAFNDMRSHQLEYQDVSEINLYQGNYQ